MSLAFSGKPSFFTNGRMAIFIGANAGGNCITDLVEPSYKVSSINEFDNIARNILSKPIEVSIT